MNIDNIKVTNDGFVYCKSNFYSALDILSSYSTYDFHKGINTMKGEIDSGIWAVSYLLSMYRYKPNDFHLFQPPDVTVNGVIKPLNELSRYICYMDKIFPLYATKKSVRSLVAKGIKENKLENSADDIKDLFHIDAERYERPIVGVGNEIFRVMAAIGYVNRIQIFCFPWFSQKRFDGYHGHILDLLNILEELQKIVILAIGG